MVRKALPLIGTPTIFRYDEERMPADMARIGTIKEADKITGGLSHPSKMPGPALNLPADECKVGGRLQEIQGAVCERCYALTNRYRHPNVIAAMRRRFEGIFKPDWTPAMALTISKKEIEFFRWHDSGDVQSVEHLLNIVTVAKHTPDTRHWLPTREYELVRQALREVVEFPENLVVRVSAHMIGDPAPNGFANTSTVNAGRPSKTEYVCPSKKQGNRCGKCRACWTPEIRNVEYPLH